MSSLNRSKKSSSLKSGTTQQATLVSGEDVTMQSKSKRIPLENISNDEVVMEEEAKTRKDKPSRGKKTALISSNKSSSVNTIPSFFRGGGASKATKEEVDEAAEAVAVAATAPSNSKQPIDPPGALWNPSGNMHGGHHPSFQPVGFSMPMWGPPHHEGDSNNSGRSWAVPPFLAPLAATVRHPFSHFVPNGHGHFPYWQQQHHHHHQGGNRGEEFGTPMEADMESETKNYTAADATMKDDDDDDDDDDASVESDASNKVDIADIQPTTLPSTFAPQECVDKIRAKANAGQVHVIQTRSMTAKRKLSKQKVSPIAAHQASSPPSTKEMGKGIPKTAAGDDSPVEVMTVLGKTVHMIDADRKVFVIDLLDGKTCDEIRMMADNHTRNAKKDTEVWRTLYTYTKMDLPVVEVKDMVSKYTDNILYDVKKIVGVIFGMRREAMRLRPRSWKEPHLLLYQALDGIPHHTGIEMHYDGCDVTWQAMLTRNDEYEGGGTYFRCLRKTIKLKQGQVLVHPGELYHKGIDITYGVRCLLVCFTDGMDPKILDDSKQEDDDPKYETNVLIC